MTRVFPIQVMFKQLFLEYEVENVNFKLAELVQYPLHYIELSFFIQFKSVISIRALLVKNVLIPNTFKNKL